MPRMESDAGIRTPYKTVNASSWHETRTLTTAASHMNSLANTGVSIAAEATERKAPKYFSRAFLLLSARLRAYVPKELSKQIQVKEGSCLRCRVMIPTPIIRHAYRCASSYGITQEQVQFPLPRWIVLHTVDGSATSQLAPGLEQTRPLVQAEPSCAVSPAWIFRFTQNC